MDSIRFGYDPMVYVVEKQEPPPGVAASGPPSEQGGWVSRAPGSHAIAECQGCIAEQGIQHVCGSNSDRGVTYHSHEHNTDRGQPYHDHMTTSYNPNRWQLVQSMNIQGPPPVPGQSVHHAVHMQMQPPVMGPMTIHEGPGNIQPMNMQDTQMNMQQPGIVTDTGIGASMNTNYARGSSYGPSGQIITGPSGNMQIMSPPSCTLQEGPRLLSPRSDQSDVSDQKDDGYSSVASVPNQASTSMAETSSGAYDTQYGANVNQDYSIQSRAQPVAPSYNRPHEYSYERNLSQPSYMSQPIGFSFAHKTADGKLILVNSLNNQGNTSRGSTNPSQSENVTAPSPRDPYMQPLYRNERGEFTPVPAHVPSHGMQDSLTRNQPPPSQLSYQPAPPAGGPLNYSTGGDAPSSVQTSPLDLKVSKLENVNITKEVSDINMKQGPASDVTVTQEAASDVRSNTPDEVFSLPDDNVINKETVITKTSVTETQGEKLLGVLPEEVKPTDASDKTLEVTDGIKKGTPLYGLPSWWGEDEMTCNTVTEDKDTQKADEEVKQANEGCTEAGADKPMDGESSDAAKRKPEHAYLEISFDDMNVNKPPIEESRNGAHTPPTRDTGPGEDVQEGSPGLNTSSTSFTIDMGGEEMTDKKPTRKSLSDFLPSKMRRSFKQRETETKKASTEDDVGTCSAQKSEGWDHSKSPHSQRKSGYLSEGNKSLLSSEEEDLSIRSDTYTTKARKQPQAGRPPAASTRSKGHTGNQTKPPTRPKTPKDRPKTPKDQSNRGTRTAAGPRMKADPRTGVRDTGSRIGPDPLRATKSTPYLIEKMFTPEAGSYKDDMDEQATEFALYKEARAYSSQNISSTKPSKDVSKNKKSLTRVDRQKQRHHDKDDVSEAGTYTVEQNLLATPRETVEDNVSEAGTYTIDAGTSRDEEAARTSIDEVFGVPGDDGGAIIDAVLYPDDRSNTPTQGTPRNGTPLMDDARSDTPTGQEHQEEGYYEQVSHDGLTWVTQWASVVKNEANTCQTPPPKAEEQTKKSKKKKVPTATLR